ncbi:MAG: 3-dehydroquinate synthase [Oscillospiraceae bacterium]
MQTIKVNASRSYDIYIDKGLLDKCGELISSVISSRKAAIVTDDNVDRYYGERAVKAMENAGFTVVKFVFPHGEASKSHNVLLKLYDFLAENGFTRSDFLVALGGGVVGDLTGFAAATYMRGIDFVQIPTTVLSQVDSSVGGKTAVDIKGGKNLVGAFHQPRLVICDTDTLDTLTPEFFADGMAEVVKYGMIKSHELFDILANGDIRANIADIIARCVSIKADVVANDEFDRGERALLNFGHTLGHAIEKHLDFSGISHGYAVAIGMSTFTHIAEQKGICKSGTAEKLDALLDKCALPKSTDIPMDVLYKYSLGDKKRSSSGIDIILCSDIGTSQAVKMTIEEYASFLSVD